MISPPSSEAAEAQGGARRLRTLIVELTPRCNHACSHCYNVWRRTEGTGARHVLQGELDAPGTLTLLAKAIDETGCSNISLTGGEPLLRPDLPEILNYLLQREVTTALITNGRLLTELTVVDLLERGTALFELPLLSHRRRVHDRLSGAPGAFDAVLAAMARIRLHRGQFVAVFVITRRNLPDLGETIRLAFAMGARGLMLNRFNPGGRGREHVHDLLPTPDQVQQALGVADSAASRLGFPIACSIPIQPCLVDTKAFPHIRFGFCAAGTDNAYYTLGPLGGLRPCNHTSTVLGNLLEETFADLTAPDRIASFVEASPPMCAACERLEVCRGGCKAAAQACYGSLRAEDPFLHRHRSQAAPFVQVGT